MPITATCPNCDAHFRLGDAFAGKRVKCQQCSHVFTLPQASADADESADKVSAEPPKPRKSPPPPLTKSRSDRSESKSRRKPSESSSGGGMMMIVMLLIFGGGFLLCLPCVGVVGWLAMSPQTIKQEPIAIGPIAEDDKRPDPKFEFPKDKADDKKDGPLLDKRDGPPFDRKVDNKDGLFSTRRMATDKFELRQERRVSTSSRLRQGTTFRDRPLDGRKDLKDVPFVDKKDGIKDRRHRRAAST